VEDCEVVWAIKDKSITSTFIDPGAAQFCLSQLNKGKQKVDEPMKRLKYTEESNAASLVLKVMIKRVCSC